MTHDHGTLYLGWRKMEQGISALEQEINREQVQHIDLADYQPGASHYERLMGQLEQAQRFQWPSDGYAVNV